MPLFMHLPEETQKQPHQQPHHRNASQEVSVWRHYLQSFTDSSLLRPFLLDVLFWGILLAALRSFSWYIQNKANALGFISPEQFQNMILSAPEQAAALAGALQSMVIQVFLGGTLLVIGAVLLYSFTRAYAWNFLQQQKLDKHHYWRWNGLVLAFLVITLLYLIPVLLVKFLLANFLAPLIAEGTWQIVNAVANSFLLLVLLSFLFLVKHSFTQKYRVFEAIGQAFHLIKERWSGLWKLFLLALLTALILALASIPLQKWLFVQQTALLAISAGIFLLFLAWLRAFMVRVLQHH